MRMEPSIFLFKRMPSVSIKRYREKRKKEKGLLCGYKEASKQMPPQTKQAIAPQNSISKAVEAGRPLL